MGSGVIDWDKAMEQVGGDVDFLKEVLNDLLNESESAQSDMDAALADKPSAENFSKIQKAAHRIKGSASYLCCEDLRVVSLKLQDAGNAASKSTEAEWPDQLTEIKGLFTEYQTAVAILRTEIAERFP